MLDFVVRKVSCDEEWEEILKYIAWGGKDVSELDTLNRKVVKHKKIDEETNMKQELWQSNHW